CGTLQASENEIVYASTVLEAEEYVRKLALESKSRSKSKKPQRGLGVRRRIINIIDALVDLNRGRPVAIVKVIQEAAEAGITLSKTSRVLYDLIDSGAVIEIEDGVTIGHEDEHS
ncbi:MAG: hypothetical protein JSW61_00480, partial [Candidatus Thorarchaeota archaeon]